MPPFINHEFRKEMFCREFSPLSGNFSKIKVEGERRTCLSKR
jgi:hypothetical protein